MSVQKQHKKKGGNKKHGRNKRKPAKMRYKNENRRFKNKLKRVRQSCGEAFAREWRRKYWRP